MPLVRPGAEVEQRLGKLVEITGAPLRTIQAIACATFNKSLRELTDEEGRRVRSEIFLQYSEMQYGFDRDLAITVFKEFWAEGQRITDDLELFIAWKAHLQKWAVENRVSY
ncbi:hypothetical protein ACN4EK_10735 [Pantanalinema rosaneae CENA516]|uniref:hypothetical protein n=1 Tax=Pantanalinema rosaneae TaxID=1620701 RepID=UPI003D6EC58D